MVCVALLGGCGAERDRPPDLLSIKRPGGFDRASYPGPGISFRSPARWRISPRESPGVATIDSAEAVIGVWAYDRKEPLPRGEAALADARDRLVDEVRRRDPDFGLDRATTLRVDGAPAIQILGDQTFLRRRLRVRSTHVFRRGTEYVIDAMAPADEFARVDRETFAPVLRSVDVAGPRRRR